MTKACIPCGTQCADAVSTCLSCGEASWFARLRCHEDIAEEERVAKEAAKRAAEERSHAEEIQLAESIAEEERAAAARLVTEGADRIKVEEAALVAELGLEAKPGESFDVQTFPDESVAAERAATEELANAPVKAATPAIVVTHDSAAKPLSLPRHQGRRRDR